MRGDPPTAGRKNSCCRSQGLQCTAWANASMQVGNGTVMSEGPSTVAVGGRDVEEEGKEYGCLAEELADARLLSKKEAAGVIESLAISFLQAILRGEDPELFLVRHPNISSFIPVYFRCL